MNETGVGIICGNPPDKENAQLVAACKVAGLDPFLVQPSEIGIAAGLSGKEFSHPHHDIDGTRAFIVRGVGFGILSREFFRMDVLHGLERRGKILLNCASATERALDKIQTSVALDEAGIPTPATVACESVNAAIKAFDELGGDVLVKPIYGSQGRGIFRLQEKGYAERVIIEGYQQGHVFYLQEFHPHTQDVPGGFENPFDVRIIVIGGEPVATMARVSKGPTDWKTNVHAGAIPVRYKPPAGAVELAVKAAGVMGLEIAGVDLLHSAKASEWLVLEVNCSPGWTGLSRVCDVDVPGLVALHAKERLNTAWHR